MSKKTPQTVKNKDEKIYYRIERKGNNGIVYQKIGDVETVLLDDLMNIVIPQFVVIIKKTFVGEL